MPKAKTMTDCKVCPCAANLHVFHSQAALKCPMVLIILAAIALVHCIVGAGARINCIPMATTSVVIHWGPGCAGEGRRVVAKRMDEWPVSGRCLVGGDQAVCKSWSCVCC